MSMKLVERVQGHSAGRFAKVMRDSEWNEYRVQFFADGIYQRGADYHTEDREDALDTAKFVVGQVVH